MLVAHHSQYASSLRTSKGAAVGVTISLRVVSSTSRASSAATYPARVAASSAASSAAASRCSVSSAVTACDMVHSMKLFCKSTPWHHDGIGSGQPKCIRLDGIPVYTQRAGPAQVTSKQDASA